MTIKSPNTDDVFDRWIDKILAKDLEKAFKIKGVPFQKSNISGAESVKNVTKFTAFYFQSEKKGAKTPATVQDELIDLKSLSKIKFYDFSQPVDSDKWKDKSKVPLYDTLQPTNCKKCVGTGYINCKKCGGDKVVSCKKCKGKGGIKCKDCDGTGSKSLNINIIKDGRAKTKKPLKYQCPTCFGTGKLECKQCGGTGKTPCPDCKGSARYRCDKCKGYGHFYAYSIGLVPFKQTSAEIPHLFFRSELEKEFGYRLSNVLNKVDGIKLRDFKLLNEKDVQAQLGFELDSNTKKLMSNAKKTFEKLQKSDLDKPHYPIYIFPVLELDIEAPKKKFKLISFGSESGYTVIDRGFS